MYHVPALYRLFAFEPLTYVTGVYTFEGTHITKFRLGLRCPVSLAMLTGCSERNMWLRSPSASRTLPCPARLDACWDPSAPLL